MKRRLVEYLTGFGGVLFLAAGTLMLALGPVLRLRWYAGLAIFVGLLLIAALLELPVFLQYCRHVRDGRRTRRGSSRLSPRTCVRRLASPRQATTPLPGWKGKDL